MKPRRRIIIVSSVHIRVVVGVGLFRAQGRGRRSAISRSNSRNIIAIRKNCSENGTCAAPRGSNPHSYGESFSVS